VAGGFIWEFCSRPFLSFEREIMEKKPVTRMNQDQKRFLLQELNRFSTWRSPLKRQRQKETLAVPPAVIRWQKKEAAFYSKQSKLNKAYEKEFEVAVTAIRQEIYLGTADSALAKLEAFKKRFK
jgi:hypothetical protein